MTLTRGMKKLVAALCIAAAAMAVFILFLYPGQEEEIASAERELNMLKQQKKQLERFAAAHAHAADDVRRLEKQEKTADKLLPKQINSAEFLTSLQQWSRKSGIKIEKILPGEEKTYEAYREQQIVVTGKGTYFEWLDFLYLMEQDGRFIDIREVHGKADKTGVFEAVVTVFIFAAAS